MHYKTLTMNAFVLQTEGKQANHRPRSGVKGVIYEALIEEGKAGAASMNENVNWAQDYFLIHRPPSINCSATLIGNF